MYVTIEIEKFLYVPFVSAMALEGFDKYFRS